MKKMIILLGVLSMITVLPVFSASWQVQDARKYYANGQYSQALKSITSAIEGINCNDPDAYDLRAKIYLKLNSPVSAMKDLSKEIEILKVTADSASSLKQLAIAANQRGDLYLKTKDYEKALNDYILPLNRSKELGYSKNVGAEISAKNLKKIINNKYIPAIYRIQAIGGFSITLDTSEPKDYYKAAGLCCKVIQIIAEADENDEIFKKKSEIIQEARKNLLQTVPKAEGDIAGLELVEGFFEYAVGNKTLGIKIIQGVLAEIKSKYGSDNEYYNLVKNFSDTVINILENGI